jgi:hypothetical protein
VIADDKLVLARGNRAGKLQRGAVKLPIHIDRLRRNPIQGHPIQSEAFGIQDDFTRGGGGIEVNSLEY